MFILNLECLDIGKEVKMTDKEIRQMVATEFYFDNMFGIHFLIENRPDLIKSLLEKNGKL